MGINFGVIVVFESMYYLKVWSHVILIVKYLAQERGEILCGGHQTRMRVVPLGIATTKEKE